MPTKALESILYRELSKAEGKEAIEMASPVLEEMVNYATNALARCADSTSGKPDEDVAILALYRHMIELTDAVDVLIRGSCPTPAIPLLRSQFEALLSMDYILESREHYTKRSLSWLVGYIHDQLDAHDRSDASTDKGLNFKATLERDKGMSEAVLPSPAVTRSAAESLRAVLAKPHLRPIEAEFVRLRRSRWHQLFGGPSNLRSLAEALNRGAQYDILYRQWSSVAHAQDFSSFVTTTAKGTTAIARLRDPKLIKQMSQTAATFMLEATKLVLEKFRPGEKQDYGRWYVTEVRQGYLALMGE